MYTQRTTKQEERKATKSWTKMGNISYAFQVHETETNEIERHKTKIQV